MKKIRSLKHYVFLMAFTVLACLLFGINTNAATTGKVYFSVEKFTIGQGYLIEPCEVTIIDGEKVSQITDRVLKANGYSCLLKSGTWYLEGITNADSGKIKVPMCIQNEWGNSLYTESDRDLCEFDYNSSSGWTYYCNNVSPNYLADSWEAHNGDVIRWRFTLYYGDLGSDRLTIPGLDSLTKSMAVFNANKQLCVEKGYQSAYNEALNFVTNMDSYYIDESQSGHTQKEIEAKIQNLCNKLPTEASINQWEAEKAAAEKAAAEKAAAEKAAAEKAAAEKAAAAKKAAAAAKKKYTPTAPKWKSLKSTKKSTATLTWNKNSKATGYEIYMSTKKSSGYKKIATVKSWKKVTYTKTKLKRKKTYYFKIRAYKTVSKTTYRSSYSTLKKVKIK